MQAAAKAPVHVAIIHPTKAPSEGDKRSKMLDMWVIGDEGVGHRLWGGWHLGKEPADVEPVPGEGVESGRGEPPWVHR